MNFEIVYNKSLKIFSQLYVGVKPAANGQTPLAFATPYEDTAAGRKRQETVKTWVGDKEYLWDSKNKKQIIREYTPDLRMIENTARAGFRITDDVKRVYWGGGNVVWRIEDPAGWEVEIQSNNLMALLLSVGVQPGGEINGECIWARDGANNVLIPVSSQEYKDAVKAAESVKAPSKIPMKDRVIGRYYRLQDGTFAQYLGKFYITEIESGDVGNALLNVDLPGSGQCSISGDVQVDRILNGEQEQYEVLYVPPYTAGSENYKYTVGGALRLLKSAPLIAELDQGSLTEEQVLAIVAENTLEFAGTKKSLPALATRQKPADVFLDFVPISDEEFKTKLDSIVKAGTEQLKQHKRQVEQGYWKNSSSAPPPPPPPKLSICQMFLWGRVCLLDGNHLYAFSSTLNSTFLSTKDSCDVIGSVQPRNGDQYTFVKPKMYHPTIWKRCQQYVTSGKALVLPKFDTIDELKAYLTELHNQKKLVKSQAKETA